MTIGFLTVLFDVLNREDKFPKNDMLLRFTTRNDSYESGVRYS